MENRIHLRSFVRLPQLYSCLAAAFLFVTAALEAAESFSHTTLKNGRLLLQIQHAESPASAYRIDLHEIRTEQLAASVTGFARSKLPFVMEYEWNAAVPEGVYEVRLFAGERQVPLIHDAMQMPEAYGVDNAKIDRKQSRIRWSVPRSSIARVNAVLVNGMKLDTIVPWHFTSNARQSIEWSFKDRQKVKDYRSAPALQTFVQYIPLPDYLLVVGKPAFEGYATLPMFRTLPLPAGDQEVKMEAVGAATRHVDELPQTAVPVVGYGSGIRVTLDPKTKTRIGATRYEVMIYADGEFLYEEPEGADPYTFLLPELPQKSGLVYLSVNIMDYDGNSGSFTLPVWYDSKLD